MDDLPDLPSFSFLFLLKGMFIYLKKAEQREGGKNRDHPPTDHFPRGYKDQGNVPGQSQRPRTWVTEAQALGPFSAAFPGAFVENWIAGGAARMR